VTNRLDNFVIGLTNRDPLKTFPVYKNSYTICAQYNGSVAAGKKVAVACATSKKTFRYVIVHGSQTRKNRSLCLAEVSVYLRSKYHE